MYPKPQKNCTLAKQQTPKAVNITQNNSKINKLSEQQSIFI